MSSSWGKNFKISVFGESHGRSIGVVLDGVPAGLTLDMEELNAFMQRRAPGKNKASTPRKELDSPQIQSGFYKGVTTGTPLCAVILNGDQHSADYTQFASVARPGHADYTGFLRYAGYNDVRGGGHFSGRLTAPLCFAGGVAKQLLAREGILVGAHACRIAGIDDRRFDPVSLGKETLLCAASRSFPTLDEAAGNRMAQAIEEARLAQDSVGGVVECGVTGLSAGIGSPMFDGLENTVASIVFGIPAVKGLEFGAGFAASDLRGSENNDPFALKNGKIAAETNNAGGILGGISTGMPVILRVAFKPTPSISQEQQTVDFRAHTQGNVSIHGRHDPCVVVRAVPVVEAAVAIAVAEALLDARGYEGLRATTHQN
ncbi:chorismate synthase [Anaerotruncus sp. AF02-27]|uniref:chorismate synthase n=1 Tax=Anaerotruncus TaxID=244127 RepID=UPI000E49F0A0|nr:MULTISPECIES: chorismate synthase [Anaerotruncus]RGX55490.1 chorismate synthase [Anaerotruncus sp. AF02-27]